MTRRRGTPQPGVYDPSERVFQQHVTSLAVQLGWVTYHTHDSRRSQPGFPDLVLVHPQRLQLLFAELKSRSGAVRVEQRVWLSLLQRIAAAVPEGRVQAHLWRPRDMDRAIPEALGARPDPYQPEPPLPAA